MRRRAGEYSSLWKLRARAIRLRGQLAPAGPAPRILVTSIPKAGTHLATQILDLLPDLRYSGLHIPNESVMKLDGTAGYSEILLDQGLLREKLASVKYGQYVTSHMWGNDAVDEILAELGYKVVFVCRDPRDIALSATSYIKRLKRHRHHYRFNHLLHSDFERTKTVIEGFPADDLGPWLPSLRHRLELFLPWLTAPGTISCRFEDLVGSRGGGSDALQREAIRRIAEHVDRSIDERGIAAVAERAWSTSSATFTSGMTGGWRDRFDPDLLEIFDAQVGPDLMRAYGYG